MTDYGAQVTMAGDFVKFANLDDSSSYPSYLLDLMVLMVAVTRNHLGNTAYMGNDFAEALIKLINSGNSEV